MAKSNLGIEYCFSYLSKSLTSFAPAYNKFFIVTDLLEGISIIPPL